MFKEQIRLNYENEMFDNFKIIYRNKGEMLQLINSDVGKTLE